MDDLMGLLAGVVSVVLLFAFYYFTFEVRKVKLYGKKSNLEFLKRNVPILSELFKPTFYMLNAKLQSVFRYSFVRKKQVHYVREFLPLNDGEVIALDWSHKYHNKNPKGKKEKIRPIIFLIPGLLSDSRLPPIKRILHQCDIKGYRGVVMNNRGEAGLPLTRSRITCVTSLEDLDSLVGWLHQRYPAAPIAAVGFSLGGTILTAYSTNPTCQNVSRLTCIMTISSPWNVLEANQTLSKPLNRFFFSDYFQRTAVRFVRRNEKVLGKVINCEALYNSISREEFDKEFYKLTGFDYYLHYLKAASVHDKVHQVRVAMLCLTSEDDPFYPCASVPRKEAESSDNLVIASTKRGGHLGFIDAVLPGQEVGFYEKVFSQYVAAMFKWSSKIR